MQEVKVNLFPEATSDFRIVSQKSLSQPPGISAIHARIVDIHTLCDLSNKNRFNQDSL
ncbi:MAG: hypothetical protein LW870_17770 [Pirellula sp.]|nr:hypothetical protein [Pirellula sp.]